MAGGKAEEVTDTQETVMRRYYGLAQGEWRECSEREYASLVKWIEAEVAGAGAAAKMVDTDTGETTETRQVTEPAPH